VPATPIAGRRDGGLTQRPTTRKEHREGNMPGASGRYRSAASSDPCASSCLGSAILLIWPGPRLPACWTKCVSVAPDLRSDWQLCV
jgi:hypothetical protein